MATDYSQYCIPLPHVTYTLVEIGRDPLTPSYFQSRAVGSGTGGVYVAFDTTTAYAEKKDNLEHSVLYQIKCNGAILVLDLKRYCQESNISPEACYSGEHSLEKEIHKFYGQGVPAMCWPSNQRSEGTSAVLLVNNIPDFSNCFSAIAINTNS
ncbi:MAG: hypothetical protein Q8Q08_08735 [Candidatus Omnitrophota bacterium]|nr:hypothetical protein [Candidatus Omnitrophota bacterium]